MKMILRAFIVLMFFYATYLLYPLLKPVKRTAKLIVHIYEDGVVFETPRAKLLIDGGEDTLERYGNSFDYVILTNHRIKHVENMLNIFDEIKFSTFSDSGPLEGEINRNFYYEALAGSSPDIDDPLLKLYVKAAKRNYVPVAFGDVINIGDLRVEVLGPVEDLTTKFGFRSEDEKVKETSIVLRVIYSSVAFLYPSDIGVVGQNIIVESAGKYLSSNVVFAASHCGAYSYSTKFYDFVDPVITVLTKGEEDASQDVYEQLSKRSKIIDATRGYVKLHSDGLNIW